MRVLKGRDVDDAVCRCCGGEAAGAPRLPGGLRRHRRRRRRLDVLPQPCERALRRRRRRRRVLRHDKRQTVGFAFVRDQRAESSGARAVDVYRGGAVEAAFASVLEVRVRRDFEEGLEPELGERRRHQRGDVHLLEMFPAPRGGRARGGRQRQTRVHRKRAPGARGVGELGERPARGVARRAVDAAALWNCHHVRRREPSRSPSSRERGRYAPRASGTITQEGLHAPEQQADGAVLREHRRHARADTALLNLGRRLGDALGGGEHAQRAHERASARGVLGRDEAQQRAAPPVRVVRGQHAKGRGAREQLEERREPVSRVECEESPAGGVEPLAHLLQRGDAGDVLRLVLRERVRQAGELPERAVARDPLLQARAVVDQVERALRGEVRVH